MTYARIKTLKEMVQFTLAECEETRNSDIALTIEIWKRYFPQKVFGEGNELHVYVRDLFDLPREDNVKRIRAYFQNEKKQYPPTVWEVAQQRGYEEDEWRVALGYPTKNTIEPSYTPPSERTPEIDKI